MNPLDRPVWWALKTRQSEFARGGGAALAFRTDVEPFAASMDDDAGSLQALAALAVPGENLLLIQAEASPSLPMLELVSDAVGVQMVAQREIGGDLPAGAVALGDEDAPDMIALAQMTRPGPFRANTHKLGQFWGVRREGVLVAMAGERLKLPGFTEVSGVCTHPDWRGHGFARQLSQFVAAQIQRRGNTPFLHAYADNDGAIGLYRQLGFEVRTEMQVQSFGLAS